jgi:hypothetical protein
MARLCRVRALNVRTRVREQARVLGGLERGGGEPSSEAEPAQGGREPSSEAEPARGCRGPSSEAEPARGGREPSSEAEPARGGLRLGHFGGPRGPSCRGPCLACEFK